ncbi:MAG: class I SAM-dependent methyltransferase [Rhodomicrobiaceae bacterium]
MSSVFAGGSAAEKMDGIYRRQRFIYDATRRYYLLGRDRLISDLQVPAGGTVLEIGCGTARNLVKAARRYPAARFYGLDISEAMLQTAEKSVVRSGVQARIVLARADATLFDARTLFGITSFDRVFISYSLSMIPAWEDVVTSALSRVAPGGALLIVDFGDFEGYPELFRKAQFGWLQRFSVAPIPAFSKQVKTVAAKAGFAAKASKLYGGYAICLRLTRN